MNFNDTVLTAERWASGLVEFGGNWFIQSSLLLAIGLTIGMLMRSWGSAVQSVIYRTTWIAIFACPLATLLLSGIGATGWSPGSPLQSLSIKAKDVATVTGEITSDPFETRIDDLGERSVDSLIDEGVERRVGADSDDDDGQAALALPVEHRVDESNSRAIASPSQVVVMPTALVVCCLWFTVSTMLLVRLYGAWRQLKRLCRSASPAEPPASEMCHLMAAQLGVKAPSVRRSPLLTTPCLSGLSRPLIILPELEVELPLGDILIHELAHLRRRDCHWNLARRVSTSLFFFQPLLWLLSRRLDATSEEVCDDFVVQFGDDRSEYAHRLVDIAELSTVPVSPAAVGMVTIRSMLSHRVARIMDSSRSLSTRVGRLLLALILIGGLSGTLTVGMVGAGSQALETSTAATDQPNPAAGSQPGKSSDAESAATETPVTAPVTTAVSAPVSASRSAKAVETDRVYSGRVVGADGKPAVGAKFYWFLSRVHDIRPMEPKLMAVADKHGKFHFELPTIEETDRPGDWQYRENVVVTAEGHGFRKESPGTLQRDLSQLDSLVEGVGRLFGGVKTISLPPLGEPVRGRVVTIDGLPVAGATVRVRWYDERGSRSYRTSDAAARDKRDVEWRVGTQSLLSVIEPRQLCQVLPMATTDEDGRFELNDLCQNLLLQLMIAGDGIETTELIVRNEPGEVIEVHPDRHTDDVVRTVHSSELICAAGPSKPLVGRVLDLDTGEPIADAIVRAYRVHGNRLNSSRERWQFATTSDEKGHYRIDGLPMGDGNRVEVFTTGDLAYIPIGAAVDTSGQEATGTCDFHLQKGVWATGRIYDSETGRSFTGAISYFFFQNRELEKKLPGLRYILLDGRYQTNRDGEFRLPVLPSRGIIAYRHTGEGAEEIRRYPRGAGAESIEGAKDLAGLPSFATRPHYLHPNDYQYVAGVAPEEGQSEVQVDIALSASQPIRVRVVDSQQRPVTDFSVYGAALRWGWQSKESATFDIVDRKPGETRKLFVFQRSRKLSGACLVKDEEEITIELQPAGTIRGRLVDPSGEPITDASLFTNYEKLRSSEETAIWANHPKLSANPTTIPVGEDGEFTVEGMVPGWQYNAHASAPRRFNGRTTDLVIGSPFEGVVVEPGEDKDLGNIVIESK